MQKMLSFSICRAPVPLMQLAALLNSRELKWIRTVSINKLRFIDLGS